MSCGTRVYDPFGNDVRRPFVLPMSAIVAIGLANSSAKTVTDFFVISLVEAI